MAGRGFTHPALLAKEDNRYRAHGRNSRLIAPSCSTVEPRAAPSLCPGGFTVECRACPRYRRPLAGTSNFSAPPWSRRIATPAPPWNARALPHPLHRGIRGSPQVAGVPKLTVRAGRRVSGAGGLAMRQRRRTGRGIVSRQWRRAPRGVGREAVDPRAGRNGSGMIRTHGSAPRPSPRPGPPCRSQISPHLSVSIANCCTKLVLTSLSSRWLHPLNLDTIPQVGSARTTRRSTGRRTWERGDQFRPTARYSAATTARGVAQPAGP